MHQHDNRGSQAAKTTTCVDVVVGRQTEKKKEPVCLTELYLSPIGKRPHTPTRKPLSSKVSLSLEAKHTGSFAGWGDDCEHKKHGGERPQPAHLVVVDRLVHALLGTTLVEGTKARADPARPERHKKEVCFIVVAGVSLTNWCGEWQRSEEEESEKEKKIQLITR